MGGLTASCVNDGLELALPVERVGDAWVMMPRVPLCVACGCEPLLREIREEFVAG
jgi:hypothetical protein